MLPLTRSEIENQVLLIEQLVSNGQVSRRPHTYLPLYVYKYSKMFEIEARNTGNTEQYRQAWTSLIKSLRGLILNDQGQLVARSFEKFFNIEDEDYLYPSSEFHVYEKLDGSAIIAFLYQGELVVCTLGSFESEQAIKAKEMLATLYKDYLSLFKEGYTYVFEILYPENQIVIKYLEEKLVLIAYLETDTGINLPIEEVGWPHLPKIYTYSYIDEIIQCLKKSDFTNEEGFVVHWPEENKRIKFKYAEYFKIHKIRSQLSPKYIWEMLRNGQDPLVVVKDLPDEFIVEVQQLTGQLLGHFKNLEMIAKVRFSNIQSRVSSRKEFAELAKQSELAPVYFKMLDNRSYSDIIWKMIEPIRNKEDNDS